jgi:hypothetical protein
MSINARPVITPRGTFPSATEAALAFGITKQAVSLKALRRTHGWRYVDDRRPEPPAPPGHVTPAPRPQGGPRPVITPEGNFPSVAAAARTLGIDLNVARIWAYQQFGGWRYAPGFEEARHRRSAR